MHTTSQPDDAQISPAGERRRLDQQERRALSTDLMNGVRASIAARGNLEANLKDARALYEMETAPEQNDPWPGASNVIVPIVPTQVESTLAYGIARAIVPRFFIVTGNTPQAAQAAYQVERYYGAELVRQRGRTTWYDALVTWMHLGLVDGVGYMEAMWKRQIVKKKIALFQPRVVDGVPVIDPADGKPQFDKVVHEVEVKKYDDVQWVPRALKDVGMIPSTAPSIEDAVAVWVTTWMYESDLRAMIREGTLWEDSVEKALSYVDTGSTDDVASDPQGSYEKTSGGQIEPGLAQGSHTSPFFKNRGPIKVFRIHSRQYDMDNDGEPEENIFFYHEKTQECLGWMPYEYLVDERPIFEWCPYPRLLEAVGFSLPLRLAGLTAEVCKMYNDRNNAIDIKLLPPRIEAAGAKLDDNGNGFGPGVKWEGEKDAVTFLAVPDIPIASFQEEALTKGYITELTGQNQPMLGAQSSGRRSATESRIQSAATGTRNDLIVMRFRIPCRSLINFTHRLKLQYLQDDPQVSDAGGQFTLPREVLAQDYRIDISGASDPMDAATRLSQDLGLYQLLMANPDIATDPEKRYAVTRMVLEDAGKSNIEQIIGTAQEAMQKKQMMQQMAQQQAAQGQQPGAQQGPPQQ